MKYTSRLIEEFNKPYNLSYTDIYNVDDIKLHCINIINIILIQYGILPRIADRYQI